MARVLVVDDNELSLAFLRSALAAIGYECATAASGRAAVAIAADHRFDLLLIDARMPELDGPQTLRAIRAGDGASRQTPAIATTAADVSVHAALRAHGFVDVIGKPISVAALRALLVGRLAAPAAAVDALLDDRHALAAAGSDHAIMLALRKLLVGELDALPSELADLRGSADGLRDRLHRLSASAGFCGATALGSAIGAHSRNLQDGRVPDAAQLETFLQDCAATRAALTQVGDTGAVIDHAFKDPPPS